MNFLKGKTRRTFREAFEVTRRTLGWRGVIAATLWWAPREMLGTFLLGLQLAFDADGLRGAALTTLGHAFAFFKRFREVNPRSS